MKKYNINGVDFLTVDGRDYCKIEQCGVTAIYPFNKISTNFPVKYVLMDLDGTTVKSEEFWMYLIELTIKRFSKNDAFRTRGTILHDNGIRRRTKFLCRKNPDRRL